MTTRIKLDCILDGIVELLNTDRPQDVPEATKRRVMPGDDVRAPRLAVFLGDENVDRPRGNTSPRFDPVARRRITIGVQCTGVTDDLETLDESASPMLAWATAQLGQTNLGGLVHHITELGTSRVTYQASLNVLVATALYEVSYQTLRNDLSATKE